MRPAACLVLAVAVAGCADPAPRVETAGRLPPAGSSVSLSPMEEEHDGSLQGELEARALQALGARGLSLTGTDAGAGLLRLGFAVRPESLGAYVPGETGARWAVRPERRGFLQPERRVYSVSLALIDPQSGEERASARATARAARGEARTTLASLTDMAAAALALPRQ
jgi:hypothetical protein